MAQMSSYSNTKKYNFVVCIVECIVKNKKEYNVIVSPSQTEYTQESVEKILRDIHTFLTFLRISKSKIKYFIKKDNYVFEIEGSIEPNFFKINKYLESFGGLKAGLLKVYDLLKDKPKVEIYKLTDILE